MKYNEIEIGMRVRCIAPFADMYSLVGEMGTVCTLDGDWVGVRFDNWFESGHDLDGACERGHGLWGDASQLELAEEQDSDLSINFSFDELMNFGEG